MSFCQVSGIGNVMEQHLQALDVTQCGHLMEKRGLLKLLFSEINYENFLTIALGLGHSTLSAWTERDRKSISTETTFKGTSDRQTLLKLSVDLCHELAEDMQKKDIVGKVLTLKYKTTDFRLRTRAQTLSEATRCPEVMAAGIKRILLHEMNAAAKQSLSLRLLGVRMSSLLFSETGQRRQATLTQMFSQAAQPKASSSSTFFQSDHESHQSQKEIIIENETAKSDNTMERSSPVTAKTNFSQKKDTSIENFLSKLKPSRAAEEPTKHIRTEVYECSVCEELVHVESLEEFNQHLDTCLEIHSSPSLRVSNIDNSSSKVGAGIQKNSEQSVEREESNDDNEIPNDVLNLDNYESNINPTTSSLNQNLLCPVCEQRNFSDMTALNKHIDECLNKSAISELLQESSQQQETAKPQKTELAKNQSSKKRKGNAESHIHKKTKSGFNTLDKYFCS